MKSKGLGLGSILTIIFVIAKLIGLFAYGWVWVFAPLWIPLLLLVLIPILSAVGILVVLLFAMFASVASAIFSKGKE